MKQISGFVMLCSLAFPASSPAVEVLIEGQEVAVSGLPPGGSAVIFGAGRAVDDYAITTIRRAEVLLDDDGDGAVILDLGRSVPEHSVWFGVELSTGSVAAASPEGFPLRGIAVPPRAIPAALNGLEVERSLIQALLLRPGAGAWTLRTGDGGEGDEDGEQDGVVHARVQDFAALGDGQVPPSEIDPRDLLVVLDLESLEYFTVEPRR